MTKRRNDETTSDKKKFDFRFSIFEFPGKTRRGFTIVEMLFVLMIISVLTAIGSRTYFDERDRFIYNDALTKTMGIINTARNMATTATPIAQGGKYEVPENGYGVYINLEPADGEPHFTVFASFGDDDSDTATYNEKFDGGAPPIGTGDDYIIETFRLSNLVDFQFLLFDKGDGAGLEEQWGTVGTTQVPTEKEAVILFRPPLADTYLGDNVGTDLEELGFRFFNHKSPESSLKKCQLVTINRVQSFPAIEYSDCSESTYDISP